MAPPPTAPSFSGSYLRALEFEHLDCAIATLSRRQRAGN
jgi:hypothetical protein